MLLLDGVNLRVDTRPSVLKLARGAADELVLLLGARRTLQLMPGAKALVMRTVTDGCRTKCAPRARAKRTAR